MTHRLLLASTFIALFLAAAGATQGATVEAKSAALADIKSAIASAHEGDTVVVPAGEVSWTSPLVITKGITLQGATSIGGYLSSPAVTDKTVILDDVTAAKPRPSVAKATAIVTAKARGVAPDTFSRPNSWGYWTRSGNCRSAA